MEIVELHADDMRGLKPCVEPTAGACIAGGAVRGWFSGAEKLSDIDVFCADDESETRFIGSLAGYREIGKSKHARNFSDGKHLVQVIGLRFPDTRSLFDSFDFKLCQFAWNSAGIWATPQAIIGTLRGHLSVHKIQPGFEMDSLRRAFKYQRKGFSPCLGTLRDLSGAIRPLTEEGIKKQTEISPGGGKRVIRYD